MLKSTCRKHWIMKPSIYFDKSKENKTYGKFIKWNFLKISKRFANCNKNLISII